MNRRGFLFGAGAALAVIPAARLMPVKVPKLILPRGDLLILDDPFVVGNGMWATKSAVEIRADVAAMLDALASVRTAIDHVNCRCEINPVIIRSRLSIEATP